MSKGKSKTNKRKMDDTVDSVIPWDGTGWDGMVGAAQTGGFIHNFVSRKMMTRYIKKSNWKFLAISNKKKKKIKCQQQLLWHHKVKVHDKPVRLRPQQTLVISMNLKPKLMKMMRRMKMMRMTRMTSMMMRWLHCSLRPSFCICNCVCVGWCWLCWFFELICHQVVFPSTLLFFIFFV